MMSLILTARQLDRVQGWQDHAKTMTVASIKGKLQGQTY
jgi:hypothetical protein